MGGFSTKCRCYRKLSAWRIAREICKKLPLALPRRDYSKVLKHNLLKNKAWAVSSAGRAPGLHPGGRQFETVTAHHPASRFAQDLLCRRSRGRMPSEALAEEGCHSAMNIECPASCAATSRRSWAGNTTFLTGTAHR